MRGLACAGQTSDLGPEFQLPPRPALGFPRQLRATAVLAGRLPLIGTRPRRTLGPPPDVLHKAGA